MSTKKKTTTPKAAKQEPAKGVSITDPLGEPPIMNLPPMEAIVWENYAIRTFGTPQNVWFLNKDVCIALGLANSRDSIAGLDTDEKGVVITDTLGGRQKSLIINESGFNALIFKSRKPEARAIQKWLTAEVMPALRRGGKYDPTPLLEGPPPPPQLTLLGVIESLNERYRQFQDEASWLKSQTADADLEVAEATRRRDGLKDQFMRAEQKMRDTYNEIERILIPLRNAVRASAGTIIYTSRELNERARRLAETATFQQ